VVPRQIAGRKRMLGSDRQHLRARRRIVSSDIGASKRRLPSARLSAGSQMLAALTCCRGAVRNRVSGFSAALKVVRDLVEQA
jgi:hypothetical protein